MPSRTPATWIPMDDEHTDDPALWSWGDWCIAREHDGFHLLVSSGVAYGPFRTFEAAKQHAEDVRAD